MKIILVSDFSLKECGHGGSEWVNQVLLNKIKNCTFEYSQKIKKFDKNIFYIISNISLIDINLLNQLKECKYIIIENDYKICESRHPWRYEDSLIPISNRINYDLYEKAIAIFVQTTDHLNIFLKNDVKGNFINLKSSIWSDNDLNILQKLKGKNKLDKNVIYNSNNWIKNTNGSVEFCKNNNIDFDFVNVTGNRLGFLDKLSNYKTLVFLPLARETFCRLVVEAKCMDMNVITTNNYGATLEDWYHELSGQKMIDFLRKNTKTNIEKIINTIK